jgi:hypothetical protein
MPSYPEGVRNEDRPRRLDDRGNFGYLRNRDRAQSRIVEHALNQSHGLLADRSSWCQQHQVGTI